MAQGNPQRIAGPHIHWFKKNNPYKDEHDRDYLPAHYREDATACNVVDVAHVEAPWNPNDRFGETQWVRSLANDGSDCGLLKGIVGEADLASDKGERSWRAMSRIAAASGMIQSRPPSGSCATESRISPLAGDGSKA